MEGDSTSQSQSGGNARVRPGRTWMRVQLPVDDLADHVGGQIEQVFVSGVLFR
ncbi:MAG: hypothetical protein QM661_04795 [Solimonas sp.]